MLITILLSFKFLTTFYKHDIKSILVNILKILIIENDIPLIYDKLYNFKQK